MATGQYFTAVALALVERGHQVTVIASRHAYDHPEKTFPGTETLRGIRNLRVASTGFGKGTKMTVPWTSPVSWWPVACGSSFCGDTTLWWR